MQRLYRAMLSVALLAGAAGLAGCPGGPVLVVEPAAATFGTDGTIETFRIRNSGSGTLDWQVSEDLAWLTIENPDPAKQTETLTGSTTTGIVYIRMTVDRDALPLGLSTGTVQVTSNGGAQAVAVSAQREPESMISASATEVDFGTSQQQATVVLTNEGLTSIAWEAEPELEADKPWITVSPASGTLSSQDSTASIILTVSRDGLLANEFTGQVLITSGAGNLIIEVRMEVPPLVITPSSIDFGRVVTPQSQAISLSSRSSQDLEITFDSDAAWLTVGANPFQLASSGLGQVSAIADPDGLEPGSYYATLRIAATGTGFSQDIPVEMLAPGLDISAPSLDFGTITEEQSDTVDLLNLGTAPITWSASIPDDARGWLTLAPASGTFDAAQTLTVNVYPEYVEPGAYEAEVSVTSDSGDVDFTVSMAKPRPALLVVQPVNLDFAASRVEDIIALWNDGMGTIQWSIDATGFPDWLTLSPAPGGIATGEVSGDVTDSLTLTVDRSLAPEDEYDLSHTFTAVAAGDADNTVDISVSATVPQIPEAEIEADGIDIGGIPFINADVDQDERQFIIRNVGNGNLDWTAGVENMPVWISSFSPAQGTLLPNRQQIVYGDLRP